MDQSLEQCKRKAIKERRKAQKALEETDLEDGVFPGTLTFLDDQNNKVDAETHHAGKLGASYRFKNNRVCGEWMPKAEIAIPVDSVVVAMADPYVVMNNFLTDKDRIKLYFDDDTTEEQVHEIVKNALKKGISMLEEQRKHSMICFATVAWDTPGSTGNKGRDDVNWLLMAELTAIGRLSRKRGNKTRGILTRSVAARVVEVIVELSDEIAEVVHLDCQRGLHSYAECLREIAKTINPEEGKEALIMFYGVKYSRNVELAVDSFHFNYPHSVKAEFRNVETQRRGAIINMLSLNNQIVAHDVNIQLVSDNRVKKLFKKKSGGAMLDTCLSNVKKKKTERKSRWISLIERHSAVFCPQLGTKWFGFDHTTAAQAKEPTELPSFVRVNFWKTDELGSRSSDLLTLFLKNFRGKCWKWSLPSANATHRLLLNWRRWQSLWGTWTTLE
eukprot:TRINITY_DN5395_c0_g1_i1.p1 TRINITY_DN5395_c0_g1~~TRINITY_DN5395_c0_g1_i1.p1  ORF type:complete len:494 (+),score=66.98 TRINITY_DN5395_c0_g1_i1:151-1482(+)